MASVRVEDHDLSGHIDIIGILSAETSTLQLNAIDIDIIGARAARGDNSVEMTADVDNADELIIFHTSVPLSPGSWTLSIDYHVIPTSEGTSPALGAFRRVVANKWYVFTQSEPISARRIFPCIDEPDRKVPWKLSLLIPSGYTAASNTAIVNQTPAGPGRRRVDFAETRPLPSYLIAFVVGPFETVELGKTLSGIPVKLLVLEGKHQCVSSAARQIPRILDLLETFLGVPYPYSKLDLVAVPHPGWLAMENAGLPTFSEDLLESNGNYSIFAHELAHQWFGDLVTLRWWDDIWLNESLASWMSDKIVRQLAQVSDVGDVIDSRIASLEALQTGASVRPDVIDNGSLAFERFVPGMSVYKGVAILRLVEAFVGEATFRDGIHTYLSSHLDGSVGTTDLVKALSATSRQELQPLFRTLLAGPLPALAWELSCAGVPRIDFDKLPFDVPVCVAYARSGSRSEVCTTLGPISKSLSLPPGDCPSWVMPNVGGTGPYRTIWTKPMVNALVSGWTMLSSAERRTVWGELDDNELRLLTYTRLVRARDRISLVAESTFLTEVSRYIPEELKPHFSEVVIARFGSSAKAIHFRKPTDQDEETSRGLSYALRLVATAQQADMLPEAMELAANYRSLASNVDTVAIMTLAANSDSRFVSQLLADLPSRTGVGRMTIIESLARVHSVVDVIANHADQLLSLNRWELKRLVGLVCSRAERDKLAALASSRPELQLRDAVAEVERCVDEQQRLLPALRAWLE